MDTACDLPESDLEDSIHTDYIHPNKGISDEDMDSDSDLSSLDSGCESLPGNELSIRAPNQRHQTSDITYDMETLSPPVLPWQHVKPRKHVPSKVVAKDSSKSPLPLALACVKCYRSYIQSAPYATEFGYCTNTKHTKVWMYMCSNVLSMDECIMTYYM